MARASRLGAALAAAALALVTACSSGGDGKASSTADGSSTPPVAPSSAPPSSASPETSPAAVTEEEAVAAAELINLTQADLPGFTSAPPPPLEPESERAYTEFISCLGGEQPVHDLPSETFSSGGSGFSSSVAVFADEDAVRTDLAALARETAIDCIGTYFQAVEGTSGEVSVQRLSLDAPGTDGALGFSVAGGNMPFQVLVVGTRRTQVSLFAFGDVSEEQRDALFATLVERGSAHAP